MEMPSSRSSTTLTTRKLGVGARRWLFGSAANSRPRSEVTNEPRMIQTIPASSPQPNTRHQLILLMARESPALSMLLDQCGRFSRKASHGPLGKRGVVGRLSGSYATMFPVSRSLLQREPSPVTPGGNHHWRSHFKSTNRNGIEPLLRRVLRRLTPAPCRLVLLCYKKSLRQHGHL